MVDQLVSYTGEENLNQWKSSHAIETFRSLDDAINNADVFLGLSTKGALTKNMVKNGKKSYYFCLCKS